MARFFSDVNPIPLGVATVSAHGTPVSILSSGLAAAIAAAADTSFRVNTLEFEPMKDYAGTSNTGNVYIGGPNLNKSTGVDLIKILKPTDGAWSFTSYRDGNVFQPTLFKLDSDNNGDGVMVRAIDR